MINVLQTLLFRYRLVNESSYMQTIVYDDYILRYLMVEDECALLVEEYINGRIRLGVQSHSKLEYIMLETPLEFFINQLESKLSIIYADGIYVSRRGSSIFDQVKNLIIDFDKIVN